MIELTIEQAKQHPFNFVYIWADEEKFLRYINPKYAAVIRAKKANQNKVIALSAEKYKTTEKEYTDAIRAQFIEDFNMTPAGALDKLAQGYTVAGKNWAEGVYGIGGTRKDFAGTDITVNPDNGYFMRNGQYLPGNEDLNVYAEVKGKTVVYQRFYEDPDTGKTYMSQYNKTLKKYYAQSYSTSDGKMYSASGNATSAKDAGSTWETVNLSFDWLQKIIDWIISLFGGTNTKTLNAENTNPDQKADGFTYESGIGEAGGTLLLLAAGGMLLAGGLGKKGKKK